MKRIYSVAAGLVAGVALAVAAVTYAQPFGGMGPGAGPGMGPGYAHGMGMGPGHGPRANVDPAAFVDSRLADLKTQLKITAEQETAWQAFADTAKQQATGMQAMRAQMLADSGTAPERMAQRASAMQQRADVDDDDEQGVQRPVCGADSGTEVDRRPALWNHGSSRSTFRSARRIE